MGIELDGSATLLIAGPDVVSLPAAVLVNGHSYLARQMSKRHLEYRVLDNAFGWIADFDQAQKLANELRVEMVHQKLDKFADRYCPLVIEAAGYCQELPAENTRSRVIVWDRLGRGRTVEVIQILATAGDGGSPVCIFRVLNYPELALL